MITLFYLTLVCLTHIYLNFFYPILFYLAFLSLTLFHLGRLVPFFVVSTLLVPYYRLPAICIYPKIQCQAIVLTLKAGDSTLLRGGVRTDVSDTVPYQILGDSYYRRSGTVEPGVWRRNFPGVLAYKFGWSELLQVHTARTNSTSQHPSAKCRRTLTSQQVNRASTPG